MIGSHVFTFKYNHLWLLYVARGCVQHVCAFTPGEIILWSGPGKLLQGRGLRVARHRSQVELRWDIGVAESRKTDNVGTDRGIQNER